MNILLCNAYESHEKKKKPRLTIPSQKTTMSLIQAPEKRKDRSISKHNAPFF